MVDRKRFPIFKICLFLTLAFTTLALLTQSSSARLIVPPISPPPTPLPTEPETTPSREIFHEAPSGAIYYTGPTAEMGKYLMQPGRAPPPTKAESLAYWVNKQLRRGIR